MTIGTTKARRNTHVAIACLAASPAVSDTGSPAWMTGVNLSGAELNAKKTRINFDYVFPSIKEIDYFRAKGFRYFRLPVLMQRLFRFEGGGPDTAATTDWKQFVTFID